MGGQEGMSEGVQESGESEGTELCLLSDVMLPARLVRA
jgi:hypothetical protein